MGLLKSGHGSARPRDFGLLLNSPRLRFFDAGAHDLDELTAMFAELSKRKPLALVVTAEPFTMEHRSRILEFMARNAIPAMYEDSRFVEAGGLMSYGPNLGDVFRRSASYVDKILKGANPAILPVEQPTKFDLVINLNTAKALGLTVPRLNHRARRQSDPIDRAMSAIGTKQTSLVAPHMSAFGGRERT